MVKSTTSQYIDSTRSMSTTQNKDVDMKTEDVA